MLAHAPALMALLNPTINSFRRLVPDSLAPTHANWGHDNRSTFVRIPRERGRATRLEVRVGDGAANPYLAVAALLQAGAHGLRERIEPPAPLTGDAYNADAAVIGGALPRSLEEALDALGRRRRPARRARRADRRHLPRDEALRGRAPPELGLRLGADRVRAPRLTGPES